MNKRLLKLFFALQLCCIFVLLFLVLASYANDKQMAIEKQAKRNLATKLLLLDFCISTESSHTRHFTMPTILAPFQDFPAYYEHFPSSSFIQTYSQKP
jgi:hypothetical protein